LSITITCNGESLSTKSETLPQLLDELDLGSKKVAVELNKAIVARDTYQTTKLTEGDVIEIVHFVGGG